VEARYGFLVNGERWAVSGEIRVIKEQLTIKNDLVIFAMNN